MSKQILRLDSSLFGAQGQSTLLNNLVIEGLLARWPDATLVERNLSELPHLDASFFAALGADAQSRSHEQQQQ
ncbi:MAG TPA: hypothetical protein PKE57_06660, partial [Cellvibrionaceae bacterium]|nr:hypothetical protein [Cellvibrionaceae bacterium]